MPKPTKSPISREAKFDYQWDDITPSEFAGRLRFTSLSCNGEHIALGTHEGALVGNLSGNWVLSDTLANGNSVGILTSVSINAAGRLIGTTGKGFITDFGDGLKLYTSSNTELPSDNVHSVCCDREADPRQSPGEVGVVCTDAGLYFPYDDGTGDISTIKSGLSDNNTVAMATDFETTWSVVQTGIGLALGEGFPSDESSFVPPYRPITNLPIDATALIGVSIDDFRQTADPRSQESRGWVLAATSKSVAFSSNRGIGWRVVTPPEIQAGTASITCVSTFSRSLYLGTTQGLMISDDRGLTWNRSSLGSGVTRPIVAISESKKQDAIFVATDSAIYQGNFFDWRFSSIAPNQNVYCIVKAKGRTGQYRFYAGTDSGLFESGDDCQTWKLVSNGIGEVYSLYYDPLLNYLLVGTNGSGLLYFNAASVGIDSKPSAVATEANGLCSNFVASVNAVVSTDGSLRLFVAHIDGGISYAKDGLSAPYEPGAWMKLQAGLPGKTTGIVRVFDGRAYLCGSDPHGFCARSNVLSGKDASLNFSPLYDDGNDPSIEFGVDVTVLGGETYLSTVDYANSRTTWHLLATNDLTEWRDIAPQSESSGASYMTNSEGAIYITQPGALYCYRPSIGELITYSPPDNGDYAYRRPYVVDGKLYVTGLGGVYVSDIDPFI